MLTWPERSVCPHFVFLLTQHGAHVHAPAPCPQSIPTCSSSRTSPFPPLFSAFRRNPCLTRHPRLNSRQTLREIHLNTGTEDGSWPFGFTTIPPAVLDGSRAGAKGRFGLDLGFNAAGGGGGVPVELRDFRAEVRLVLFLLPV